MSSASERFPAALGDFRTIRPDAFQALDVRPLGPGTAERLATGFEFGANLAEVIPHEENSAV
jgi:hypothetical protein